jgi:hypothetical protein
MIMYKLTKPAVDGELPSSILTNDGLTAIPVNPANTDYANFKKEINADEAQLEDADGDLMTAEQAKEYVATLP